MFTLKINAYNEVNECNEKFTKMFKSKKDLFEYVNKNFYKYDPYNENGLFEQIYRYLLDLEFYGYYIGYDEKKTTTFNYNGIKIEYTSKVNLKKD